MFFLAAVLGFHGMLNQTQFYASERDEKSETGGFTGTITFTAKLSASVKNPDGCQKQEDF